MLGCEVCGVFAVTKSVVERLELTEDRRGYDVVGVAVGKMISNGSAGAGETGPGVGSDFLAIGLGSTIASWKG
jgi:hypothetical protein